MRTPKAHPLEPGMVVRTQVHTHTLVICLAIAQGGFCFTDYPLAGSFGPDGLWNGAAPIHVFDPTVINPVSLHCPQRVEGIEKRAVAVIRDQLSRELIKPQPYLVTNHRLEVEYFLATA